MRERQRGRERGRDVVEEKEREREQRKKDLALVESIFSSLFIFSNLAWNEEEVKRLMD